MLKSKLISQLAAGQSHMCSAEARSDSILHDEIHSRLYGRGNLKTSSQLHSKDASQLEGMHGRRSKSEKARCAKVPRKKKMLRKYSPMLHSCLFPSRTHALSSTALASTPSPRRLNACIHGPELGNFTYLRLPTIIYISSRDMITDLFLRSARQVVF